AGLVRRAGAAGLHPGPGDGEAVGVDTERSHQLHVGGHPVAVVDGHLAPHPTAHLAGGSGEGVPDRSTAPVDGHVPLDLVRGRGDAPGEHPQPRMAMLVSRSNRWIWSVLTAMVTWSPARTSL